MITDLLVCDYYILLLYACIYIMYIYIYIIYICLILYMILYMCVYMGDSITGGTSKRMVDNGKANKKWMITGGSPMT